MQPFDWVLRKLLTNPDWIVEVGSKIKPRDILEPEKKRLYEYLLEFNELVECRYAPTTIAKIEADTGLSTYIEKIRYHPEPSPKEMYEQIKFALHDSKSKSILRTFQLGIARIQQDGANANLDEILNEVFSLSKLISINGNTNSFISQSEAVDHWHSDFVSRINNSQIKIGSGFDTLDHKLNGGFEKGDLVIIASGTGQGKSMLAGQMMISFDTQSLKCGMIGLEMDHKQYVKRQFSLLGKLCGYEKMSSDFLSNPTNDLQNEEFEKVKTALKEFNFTYLIPKEINLNELKKYCSILIQKHKVDVIFLDHILLIDDQDEERLIVKKVVNFLKKFAAENNVICVAVSQMNRDADLDNPKVKDMSGGRSIEQAATALITIGTHASENDDDFEVRSFAPGRATKRKLNKPDDGLRRLTIVKARESASNVYALARFHGHHCYFEEIYPKNWDELRSEPGFSRASYQY